MTKTFSGKELDEVMEAISDFSVHDQLVGNWRWGHIHRYVFEYQGKTWMTDIQVHTTDGWQLTDELTAHEAKLVEKTVKVWERA